MESLGKRKNLAGEIVHQGIAVYGNKGSTDQHSYVQQLRNGVLNFFRDVCGSAQRSARRAV
jgi:glucose-6-phosphate isomerase